MKNLIFTSVFLIGIALLSLAFTSPYPAKDKMLSEEELFMEVVYVPTTKINSGIAQGEVYAWYPDGGALREYNYVTPMQALEGFKKKGYALHSTYTINNEVHFVLEKNN